MSHSLVKGATVAVTGGSGYLGGHIVKLCLERGYTVRASVRDPDDDKKCGFLRGMQDEYPGKLTLHAADLAEKGVLDDVLKGCTTVFHVAEFFSPFSAGCDQVQAYKNLCKSSRHLEGIELKKDARPGQDMKPGGFTLEELGLTEGLADGKDQDLARCAGSKQAINNLVESINKSGTVTRIVYTSSQASMETTSSTEAYLAQPFIDETGEPVGMSELSYAVSKRSCEKQLFSAAAQACGKWSAVSANPNQMIGPVLSAGHAPVSWQGSIWNAMHNKEPVPICKDGKPLDTTDVRDVALAHVLLAEAGEQVSGKRYLIASGDKVPQSLLGKWIMALHPDWECPLPGGICLDMNPAFTRVCYRNDRIREATDIRFRSFDKTLEDTIDSMLTIGGAKPKLKEPALKKQKTG